ncbi:MAG: hypothetical protein LBU81_05395 [Methanosarcinales archaeon]|jgi:hypothetical protein|nr:hypothetical protein [Methanosarcinales archaeon]
MAQTSNSGSSASQNNQPENAFENIKKLSDVFELETNFTADVFFRDVDDLLPALVWPSDCKLTDVARDIFEDALSCPADYHDYEYPDLFITAESDKSKNNVRDLLATLAGYCPESIYDRLVISE